MELINFNIINEERKKLLAFRRMATFTRTETHASIQPEIRFDPDYLKTKHGFLKVALMVNSM